MGAVGSQQPPHVVELRLEYPQATCPLTFFACVHSEADGACIYREWGQPQAVRLWPDDVITVTIYTANSPEDFARLRRQEFAEVYIPWSIISEHTADDTEVVFNLGLTKGMPLLGHSAALTEYLEVFYRSYRLVKDNPSAPKVGIGIRITPPSPQCAQLSGGDIAAPRAAGGEPSCPSGASAVPRRQHAEPASVLRTSNAVASGIRELNPEEMRRLLHLQVRSQELCAKLGLGEGGGPDVEEQVKDHVDNLRQAVASNYGLRAEQQKVDQELATTTASLTQEGRLIMTNDDVTPPRTPPATGDLLEQTPAEYERRATAVMAEIHAITKGSIELISQFDEQSKMLEAKLLDVRKRPLEAPLSAAQDDAPARREHEVSEILQQKEKALSALEQEIDDLQRSLEASKSSGQMEQADVGALQVEKDIALAKKNISEEQAATEEQQQILRRDLKELEENLQVALAGKLAAEREIAELQQVQARFAAAEHSRTEEDLQMESLEKELSRSQCRIDVCDEKIKRLEDETAEIRRRALLMLQTTPLTDRRSPWSVRSTELEELLHWRQEELQVARTTEEEVRFERDRLRQALGATKVEVAILEQKVRLARSKISGATG